VGKKCLFRSKIFIQPLLTFPGKIAIPRQLGSAASLPYIFNFLASKVGTIKWNYFFISHKAKSIFASNLNIANSNLANLLSIFLIHAVASVMSVKLSGNVPGSQRSDFSKASEDILQLLLFCS